MVRRITWSLLIAFVVASCALMSLAAHGQAPSDAERGAWRRTRAQGVMLARIVVSEQSRVLHASEFDAAELDWFASVVVNNRDRLKATRGWLDVLGMLAPHVTQRRPYTRPRQEWTSTLVGCTEKKPSLWVDDRDGNWNIYALRWQSLCLDVRDAWVRGTFAIAPDVITWGSVADAARQLCRSRPRLCLVQAFPAGNVFFALDGAASCNYVAQESFVEAHCEGAR